MTKLKLNKKLYHPKMEKLNGTKYTRCKILNLRLGVNKEGTMENNYIELILPLRLFAFVYRIKDSSFKGKQM